VDSRLGNFGLADPNDRRPEVGGHPACRRFRVCLLTDSGKGGCMVKITGEYQGDLHCAATHEPSGSVLLTDAPKDNQGRGAAFSPTDLAATALGTCIATTMALAARKHGIELKGLKFEVTKEMSADAPRRIVRLATQLWLPIPRTDEAAKLLEHSAHNCPVHQSLHPSVDRPITFHWAAG
jgi:putative redox protein